MNCVRTVRYIVKCNNLLSEVIIPEKGLRQRDPLSSYLFLFCMEALSSMLLHAQNNNILRGIRASINGPRINHLFFTDDALIFVKNKSCDVVALLNIFKNFTNVSRQEINFSKSMVLFSQNTSNAQRQRIGDLLRMEVVEKLDNYLGIPLPIGKKKSLAFQDINNHLYCRINSWTKRMLSFGGKEIFIKAILQSLPSYAMSVFLAPKGVIEEIQTMINRVWWSGKDWVWRLINNKDTLCYEVLSSKYFPDGNIFNFKKFDRTSFTWRSIAAAASVLKSGFGWQVGCGDRINIHSDNWGLEGLNGEAVKPHMINSNENSVRDLWDRDSRRWNTCRVWELYGQDIRDKICNLPIGDENHRDRIVWFHNSLGNYTSKSAYSWLLLKQIGFIPRRFFCGAVWKLDTLPKIRVFTWRMGNEILPTNVKLASIHHGFSYNYPRCGVDYDHALKDCPSLRATLMLEELDGSVMSKEYDRCIDWLEDMMKKKMGKPPKDCIKINFDASIENNITGYGVIIRDEDGFVLCGGGGFKDGQLSIEEAEWHAFDESIKIACRLNIKGDVLFESDCAGLVNKINGQNRDLTIIGERIKDSLKAFVNFRSATCVRTSRHCNIVADFICKKMCADACY
ncbi:reverse transcriptase [Gossypium australe]|uniref:Reverse transcriptase n=1 Tax=Gossypium australe TaxID=47621 RepID=A0A5B6UT59_9ROSI|nr:reverse transcriptase [Gossypium australe]